MCFSAAAVRALAGDRGGDKGSLKRSTARRDTRPESAGAQRRQVLYLLRYLQPAWPNALQSGCGGALTPSIVGPGRGQVRDHHRGILAVFNYFRSLQRRLGLDARRAALPSEVYRRCQDPAQECPWPQTRPCTSVHKCQIFVMELCCRALRIARLESLYPLKLGIGLLQQSNGELRRRQNVCTPPTST